MDHPILTPLQLSAHLRSLRKARNLTQAQLGARLGINQARVAKIERNPGQVSVGQLIRMLALLNTQLVLRTSATRTGRDARAAGASTDW
jgi:HTH-type transcriptional regulator/antitoxin HipB